MASPTVTLSIPKSGSTGKSGSVGSVSGHHGVGSTSLASGSIISR